MDLNRSRIIYEIFYHARKFQLGEISHLVLPDKLIIEIIH